jgi:hypothetical protein
MPEDSKKVRRVITSYLVYCNKRPVLLTRNKKEADSLVRTAVENGHESFYKDLTATEERMAEIGKNIFLLVKEVPESHVKNILQVRNRLIRETFEMKSYLKKDGGRQVEEEIAWAFLTKKRYSKPYNEMTYAEFNSWTLDIIEFYLDINR